jgi:inosine-uridine nucleoside N-ribohydrolase/sugar/nucleoside kinase (ribokinase family)
LRPELTVIGSINLDLVARVEALPRPGETVSGATLERIPGGKGANQAVAAARLDANVRMVGCVGRDANAGAAQAGLREADVALDVKEVDAPTGVAIILVGDDGENVIVVVPGANALVGRFSASGNVLCQLEIPDEAVREARAQAQWLCVNAAPARPLVVDADLVVVNRYEAEVVGDQPLIAVTLGEEGAVLLEHGKEVTRAKPPHVDAVDGTAAGDAFTACLVVSLLGGRDPEEALRRACAAGALAASRFGATPILIDCDPGHDDAIALLLALASPEVELLGVTSVAGNQTLDKTTANALRVLEFAGRGDVPVAAGADRPLVRDQFVAAYVHGETGLDGPDLPPPQGKPVDRHAVDFLAETIRNHDRPVTLIPVGPLTNVALLLALHPDARPERIVLMGGAIAEGNVTPAAEFNIWCDPEAAARVFASGIDVTMIGLDVTHKALFTQAHIGRLAGRVGEMVTELLRFYDTFHRSVYNFDGSPIHDALAVAHVLNPELVGTLKRNVEIDTESELCRGRTVVDLWQRTDREPNAQVGVEVDSDGFLELLVERINSLQ